MTIDEYTTYIVRFFKGSSMNKLHVLAHNKDQAVELAIMQCKYSKMGAGKFELISVFKEGEKDPFEIALDNARFF